MQEVLSESDVITLHCPLSDSTRHIINAENLAWVKPNVVLINTGRGALIDTRAVIEALKDNKIGALGIDVYEDEGELFFEDRSQQIIQDDVFARLQSFPNVLITGHQAFFSIEAVDNSMKITLENINAFARGIVQNQI